MSDINNQNPSTDPMSPLVDTPAPTKKGRKGKDSSGGSLGWLGRSYLGFIYALLYLPIIILVIMSFNKSKIG